MGTLRGLARHLLRSRPQISHGRNHRNHSPPSRNWTYSFAHVYPIIYITTWEEERVNAACADRQAARKVFTLEHYRWYREVGY